MTPLEIGFTGTRDGMTDAQISMDRRAGKPLAIVYPSGDVAKERRPL